MFDEVKTILARQLRIAPEKITLDAQIKRDLHADSLDILQLLMRLEDDYGVVIPDQALALLLPSPVLLLPLVHPILPFHLFLLLLPTSLPLPLPLKQLPAVPPAATPPSLLPLPPSPLLESSC